VARGTVDAMTSRERQVVLVTMCVGYFLVLLDVTVVNVALPAISDALDPGVGGLQWVVDGYALPLAALLLAAGTTGDRRGHKRVAMTGLAVFGLGSLACGLAPGTATLVAARAVQGVGAALLLPTTLAIIGRAFPERSEQARAIGVWAAVGSAALPAGPLLGGALVQWLSWRAVFLVNVPIVLVAAVVAQRTVTESRERAARPLDVPGVLTGAGFLAALTAAVIESERDGLTGLVWIAGLLAALLLGCFVVVERRAADPLLPLRLLRRPAFTVSNATAGTMNFGTLGLLFLLTQLLQSVQGRPALQAGVALLPLFLPLTLVAPYAGRLVSRIGPRVPVVLGLVVAAAGVALLRGVTADSTYARLLPALLLWGVGLAVLTPAIVSAALAAVPGDDVGLGSGVNNTARQAGGVLGIALYGAVAGSPDHVGGFLDGVGQCALVTAVLFVLAACLCLRFVPSRAAAPQS
jgi:DHA2 family methylenomycin A resistance protein-like MFS transporter